MARNNESTRSSTGEAAADLKSAAREVGQNLREVGSQMRDAAGEQYEQLRNQAADYYEQGRRRAMEMERDLEQYVKEKPLKSMLIAAGVGALLALLWKRR